MVRTSHPAAYDGWNMRGSLACGLAFLAVVLLTAPAAALSSAPRGNGVVAVDARISVRIYDGGSTEGWLWACDPKKAGSCDPTIATSDITRTALNFCTSPIGRLGPDKKSYPAHAASPGTTRVTRAGDAWLYGGNGFVGRGAGITVWQTVNCRTSLIPSSRPTPKPAPGVSKGVGVGALGVDYSMPDRFGSSKTSEGLLLYPRTKAQLAPARWRVTVTIERHDGETCLPTEELTIDVMGEEPDFKRVGPCALDVWFPREAAYSATLKLRTKSGVLRGSRTIVVQDWLIVGIGDSNGSGEGTPDRDAGVGVGGALWQNSQCHRSANSYQALTARAIERSDPRTSVTFVHLACSGASIVNGVLGRYEGIERGALLQPQLVSARRLTHGREIDAMLVSIGVNDLRFGTMAGHCVEHASCPNVIFPGTNVTLGRIMPRYLDDLKGRFDRLADALEGLVMPSRVYLNEYFDSTTNDAKEVCSPLMQTVKGTFDGAEAKWARESLLLPLNEVIRSAAEAHRFRAVTGSETWFQGHGYCATDSWIVQLTGSFLGQLNKEGSLHATTTGNREQAKFATKIVRGDLYAGGRTRRPG